MFEPTIYSYESLENKLKKQLEIAKLIANGYANDVRQALSKYKHKTYIPSGNYELLEAAAIFYGVRDKERLNIQRDLSPYQI